MPTIKFFSQLKSSDFLSRLSPRKLTHKSNDAVDKQKESPSPSPIRSHWRLDRTPRPRPLTISAPISPGYDTGESVFSVRAASRLEQSHRPQSTARDRDETFLRYLRAKVETALQSENADRANYGLRRSFDAGEEEREEGMTGLLYGAGPQADSDGSPAYAPTQEDQYRSGDETENAFLRPARLSSRRAGNEFHFTHAPYSPSPNRNPPAGPRLYPTTTWSQHRKFEQQSPLAGMEKKRPRSEYAETSSFHHQTREYFTHHQSAQADSGGKYTKPKSWRETSQMFAEQMFGPRETGMIPVMCDQTLLSRDDNPFADAHACSSSPSASSSSSSIKSDTVRIDSTHHDCYPKQDLHSPNSLPTTTTITTNASTPHSPPPHHTHHALTSAPSPPSPSSPSSQTTSISSSPLLPASELPHTRHPPHSQGQDLFVPAITTPKTPTPTPTTQDGWRRWQCCACRCETVWERERCSNLRCGHLRGVGCGAWSGAMVDAHDDDEDGEEDGYGGDVEREVVRCGVIMEWERSPGVDGGGRCVDGDGEGQGEGEGYAF